MGVEKVEFTVMFSFVENVDVTSLRLKVVSIVLVRGAALVLSQRFSSWLDFPVVLESLVVMVILGVNGENLSLSSSCKWFGMVVVSSGSPGTARGSLAP